MEPPGEGVAVQPTVATLTDWIAEEGWGVLQCELTPGGCWFLFNALVGLHPEELRVGRDYQLVFEPAEQDGYAYRAIAVAPIGRSVERPQKTDGAANPGHYASVLALTFDEGGRVAEHSGE